MFINFTNINLIPASSWISFSLLKSNLIYYLAGFSATTDNAMTLRIKNHLDIYKKYNE